MLCKPKPLPAHWLLRVGNGVNHKNSIKHYIWSAKSKSDKHFLDNVKSGDILWFLGNKETGSILLGVATYVKHQERIVGPLLILTKTNEELGWNEEEGNKSDIEIHYKQYYDISSLKLKPEIVGPITIRLYNKKCLINLQFEYSNIIKYSKVIQRK